MLRVLCSTTGIDGSAGEHLDLTQCQTQVGAVGLVGGGRPFAFDE